jgi:AcrR family transcriptional regulator
MVGNAYTRKKQPELVRRSLLDAVARIAGEQGLVGVTVQAVADAAGVTRGGLFHHFPTKQALIEAMISDMLERLDAELDRRMALDAEPHGSFTRAYVEALLVGEEFGVGSPFDALSVAMLPEPSLGQMWTTWIEGRLTRHQETDSDAMLEVVRFAADGAWLTYSGQAEARPGLTALRDRLLMLTRGADA